MTELVEAARAVVEPRPDLRVDETLPPRYVTQVGGEHHELFA